MSGGDMDRESDRVIWEKLKSEDNLTEALHMIADLGYGMVQSRKRKDCELQDEIVSLKKVILGNGDPTNSLVNKVNRLTEKATDTNSKVDAIGLEVTEIKYLLIGDVKRGPDNKSLLDRVQHAEKISDNASKVVWAVLLIVIGEVVLKILGLF